MKNEKKSFKSFLAKLEQERIAYEREIEAERIAKLERQRLEQEERLRMEQEQKESARLANEEYERLERERAEYEERVHKEQSADGNDDELPPNYGTMYNQQVQEVNTSLENTHIDQTSNSYSGQQHSHHSNQTYNESSTEVSQAPLSNGSPRSEESPRSNETESESGSFLLPPVTTDPVLVSILEEEKKQLEKKSISEEESDKSNEQFTTTMKKRYSMYVSNNQKKTKKDRTKSMALGQLDAYEKKIAAEYSKVTLGVDESPKPDSWEAQAYSNLYQQTLEHLQRFSQPEKEGN